MQDRMTWTRYAGRLMAVAGMCMAGSASAQLGFSDQTDAVGLTASQMQGDFEGMTAMMAGGGAVGDFNNDGWPDLYYCVGGGEADKLFINQGTGPVWFVDEAASWGVAVANRSVAAYVADYNNDGWQDIFVVSQGTCRRLAAQASTSCTATTATARSPRWRSRRG